MAAATDPIVKDLQNGATAAEVAERYDGWSLQMVHSLIAGKRGWSLAGDGTVNVDEATPSADGPASAWAVDDADQPATIEELLDDAAQSGVPRITRAVEKARTAISVVRDLYSAHLTKERETRERAEKQQAAIERAQSARAELDAAKAELKELGGCRKPRNTAEQRLHLLRVREWAAAEGIKVASRGRIPVHVERRYEREHPGVGDG